MPQQPYTESPRIPSSQMWKVGSGEVQSFALTHMASYYDKKWDPQRPVHPRMHGVGHDVILETFSHVFICPYLLMCSLTFKIDSLGAPGWLSRLSV